MSILQNILSELWNKHNLLSNFKMEMNKRGYVGRDLYCIQIQINLLMNIIELESKNTLSDLLKKTYYRLLKEIYRGVEYLPDIVESPDMYVLNPIEKDINAWTDKDVLIFATKTNIAVFSKITRNDTGYHYIDNKWQ